MTKYLKPEANSPLKHLIHTGANPMYAKKVQDTFKVKTQNPWEKMAKGTK